MEQRVSLITLGVRDMVAATAFYRAMGWAEVDTPDGVVAFDLVSQTLGLYPLDALADELGVDVSVLGQGALTLSYNTRSRDEVEDVLRQAQAAGAEIVKPASDVFWGGYHGYFRDPEGHFWEVAHNPFSQLRADGAFCWNGYPDNAG